ncbi:DUF4913 domain-containing protein (plasmid) [Streptosporangium sp. NBC_01495]|uniref:DUF4913 domain-containing protein n=1 Tax=Streptosporangium sp. NBC_01495 TaxID=2903899 RepID=UPI002E37CA81|nr:DUF4913 domain-containing protein [Streptosporangium sp. NBC_01495]
MTPADPLAASPHDLADLRARLAGLEAELATLAEHLEEVREAAASDAPADQDSESSDGESAGKAERAGSDGPVFILLLDDDHQFAVELGLLMTWVEQVLEPTYINEPTPSAPWCSTWWEHPEAYARLHGIWLAWVQLTTPASDNWTGPADWHRDYLDPALAALRAPDGPLIDCTTDSRVPRHHPRPQASTKSTT